MDDTSPATRAVAPRQLSWLRSELDDWASTGVITPQQAASISALYRADATHARVGVGRVLLHLGGGFVGIGLIWLVAANLDGLSPLTRFATVVVLWLAFLAGGEALHARGATPALVGGVRLLAALGAGAVIFQAAQSLQVPAFEPRLVGLWSAGALLHGYLTRARLPFLVGVGAGVTWWLWQPLWDAPSSLAGVLLLAGGAVLAAAVAVLHGRHLEPFARTWRIVATGLALVAMFVAAVPGIGATDDFTLSPWLVVALAAATLAAVGALATRPGRGTLEVVGAIGVMATALLLALWDTGTDTTAVGMEDWAHAALSVAAYVLLAVGLVALGTVREDPALTWLAMVGLVVFTTFQSFAVFAPIVTGAWLFVVLGTVFLGTGFLAERARRELVSALDGDPDAASTPRSTSSRSEGEDR